jgi:streptomycin 3"-adenylyltransferase
MDAHFWNILTDGSHLYFSDFGLALSNKFELTDEEIKFYESHRDYDYCSAATNFLHAIITGLFGTDDWINNLKKSIDAKNSLPVEIKTIISYYSSVAIKMDEFFRRLQSSSKDTPFKMGTSASVLFDRINHCEITEAQIDLCTSMLKNIFGSDLLGVYLYGSAIIGGLQKYSDIDLLVVINRATNQKEKSDLVASLLNISGIYMKDDKPPIELTIINHSSVNPWKYPPHFDFQYGEWLRKEFELGNIEPWPTKEMPDLAILITQVLLAHKILYGKSPEQLLEKISYRDFMRATAQSLPSLMAELHSDTRNVLLTLARIWNTVETDFILAKPVAADWAIDRLPENHRAVMQRAKAICIGVQDEYWEDVRPSILPCADYMLCQINKKISTDDNPEKYIRISK